MKKKRLKTSILSDMVRPLSDNMDWTSLGDLNLADNKQDLALIANTNIADIQPTDSPNLLVFPSCLGEHGDDIGSNRIISLRNDEISTGNVMGFVGINDTMLTIHSRFAKTDTEDYFLHYLLQRVFCINFFNLKHTISKEPIFDFLLYTFPYFLKKALRQGIYKKYQRFQHNDSKVRGVISVNRHIKSNIPFNGCISYTTREHSYDNDVTQLIRHTIEYIETKALGKQVLRNDSITIDCVKQIKSATPSYEINKRKKVINNNLRPIRHPYFNSYTALQRICIQILRHDSIKYGDRQDKVYGVLFDGAWLWEEYLYTILKSEGFEHPRNKEKQGGINMFVDSSGDMVFDKNYRELFHDFYKEDFVLDAKYKHLNSTVGRDDLYQVVTYMYCLDYRFGGYIYPKDGNQQHAKFKLAGIGCNYKGYEGGIISVIPFDVPQNAPNWEIFVKSISDSEEQLVSDIYAGLHF
jgi:5-methylcytosine-specific restriction endonuclease McrBC regulatory subunit McrC